MALAASLDGIRPTAHACPRPAPGGAFCDESSSTIGSNPSEHRSCMLVHVCLRLLLAAEVAIAKATILLGEHSLSPPDHLYLEPRGWVLVPEVLYVTLANILR